MSLEFEYDAEAYGEFAVALDRYAEFGVGGEFFDAITAAIDHLCMFPESAQAQELDDPFPVVVRRFVLADFPYGIIYYVQGDRLTIAAVANLKKQPQYWIERLPRR